MFGKLRKKNTVLAQCFLKLDTHCPCSIFIDIQHHSQFTHTYMPLGFGKDIYCQKPLLQRDSGIMKQSIYRNRKGSVTIVTVIPQFPWKTAYPVCSAVGTPRFMFPAYFLDKPEAGFPGRKQLVNFRNNSLSHKNKLPYTRTKCNTYRFTVRYACKTSNMQV